MSVKVGILTGGGDCPGLNPVIRAAVRKGIEVYKYDMIGLYHGWAGLMDKNCGPLDLRAVSGILPRGGTILGTSRTNPAKIEGGYEKAKQNFMEMGLDALIAIGGEDTLGVANKLNKIGVHVVGVPKTIDNDLSATDFTFGFDTSVNIIMEAIDRLHTTAESHDRVLVVEVMGRHAGWLAVYGGMAGGADVILIPEEKFDLTEVCQHLKKRHAGGKNFSIVVAAEGALPKEGGVGSEFFTKDKSLDAFGHVKLGGIADALAKAIEKNTGFETRSVVLGHLQRGGTPSAFDRVLGTRFGIAAIDLVHDKHFGKMVALQGNKIVAVPLEKAVAKLKTVDKDLYDIAKVFFG
ncbi:MAG: 6-phosphofructokinase [Candidatus Margulisbacteria bacterium]|nr:6-phosphofructokinase [Candidatus Margulisiibacteriota bacterium]